MGAASVAAAEAVLATFLRCCFCCCFAWYSSSSVSVSLPLPLPVSLVATLVAAAGRVVARSKKVLRRKQPQRSAENKWAESGPAFDVWGLGLAAHRLLAGVATASMRSTLAACSTLVALRHRWRCGRGQHVDISAQEAMLSASSICGVGKWLQDGIIPVRYGNALFSAVPSGTYPCEDGSIYLIINRPRHWQVLARWGGLMLGLVRLHFRCCGPVSVASMAAAHAMC